MLLTIFGGMVATEVLGRSIGLRKVPSECIRGIVAGVGLAFACQPAVAITYVAVAVGIRAVQKIRRDVGQARPVVTNQGDSVGGNGHPDNERHLSRHRR